MNQNEIRVRVLLSMQRALWGMIYPSIRAIAVGFEGFEKLKIICYLDREPVDEDYENLSEVTSEVCADIEFKEVEEVCIYTQEPTSKLDKLTSWVYIRKEP
jgi:hypothetical protein